MIPYDSELHDNLSVFITAFLRPFCDLKHVCAASRKGVPPKAENNTFWCVFPSCSPSHCTSVFHFPIFRKLSTVEDFKIVMSFYVEEMFISKPAALSIIEWAKFLKERRFPGDALTSCELKQASGLVNAFSAKGMTAICKRYHRTI